MHTEWPVIKWSDLHFMTDRPLITSYFQSSWILTFLVLSDEPTTSSAAKKSAAPLLTSSPKNTKKGTVECQLSSDIQTRRLTERPSDNFFLINTHILWRQLHEKTALNVYFAALDRWWFRFFKFCCSVVISSSFVTLLAVVLRMSSVNSPKTKALRAEY